MGCGPHKGWLVHYSTVDSIVPSGQGFTGPRPSGRSGAWRLATTEGKWRGRYQDSVLVLTGAWTVTRRCHDGGEVSALSNDGAGAIEDGRR
jgi:hypothetical protein